MTKHKTSEVAIKKSGRNLDNLINNYVEFLDKARTPSLTVKEAVKILEKEGFEKFNGVSGSIQNSNGKSSGVYFIDRNGVNIAAVKYGNRPESNGINIAGAHVDFCTLTNKVHSLRKKHDGVYLDTRPYGGFFPHQWMDRPLSIIGETLVKNRKGKRELVEWRMSGQIPEPTIHNPKGYREKKYTDAFNLENLDVFTGYKDEKAFLKALNEIKEGKFKVKKSDFNSGYNQFHVVPEEQTQILGDYIVGYGHDDRSCMFAALYALTTLKNPEYTAMALGVAREEIGSTSVGSANDVFLDNVLKELFWSKNIELNEIYNNSVMLSADVDIAYNPQNKGVNDKENCSHFGRGAAVVIANGSNGNPTGNIVMPKDLCFIEEFLNKKHLAYQVTALPSKVGIGGGGGTIAQYYSEKGVLTADVGIPVGNMHGTSSRIYAADLDSTVQAFKGLFERTKERPQWG